MFFSRFHLALLLTSTLLVSGCGTDAPSNDKPAENIGTDNGGTDNSGSDNSGSDNSGTDNSGTDNNGSDNSGSDNGGTDNSGSDNSGSDNSGTDNGGSDNTSTDTDTDTNEATNSKPAVATWLNMDKQIALIDGRADFTVKWQKNQGNNGFFWRLLVNDNAVTDFITIAPSQTNMQSGQHTLQLQQTGKHTLHVQLCQDNQLNDYCSVSAAFELTVTEDPRQYQSEQGQPLFSAWNNQFCLSANDNAVELASCQDTLSQQWLLEDQQIKSANDVRLCLQAKALDFNAAFELASCTQSAVQNWQYTNGSLVNQGWSVDIDVSKQAVIVWSSHDGLNQRWNTSLEETDTNTDSPWARVDVPMNGPYGNYQFNLPAAQNWVNTGLFLTQGQTAHITATGQWSVKGDGLYDANGHASKQARGCQEGEFTARLGLYYKDPAITCIGSEGTFTAHEDGILFVGSVVSNDLGETYEQRAKAVGSMAVSITSQGNTVPTIDYDVAPYYNFAGIKSGWVEIQSEHNILTLPIATAIHDASKLTMAMQRLDDIYSTHEELRGKTPYHGQPIRWYPDTKDAPGWMLAGNPVRMDPALTSITSSDRITLAAEPGNNDWGFAHELGHNFNFAGGDWYYTTFGNLESWPNIFTLNAIEKLGLPPRKFTDCDAAKSEYLAKGVHEDGLGGAWTGLCFLTEITDQHGFEIWKNFYHKFNTQPGHGWRFLRDRLNEASGADVTPIFQSWKIPL